GIHRDAVLNVVLEPFPALEDDQRADPAGRERRHREDDVGDRFLGVVPRDPGEERVAAERGQRPSQLLREENDDREGQVEEDGLEDGPDRRQPGEDRDLVDDERCHDPEDHLDGARAADQAQEAVDEQSDDEDVHRIAPGDREVGEGADPPAQGLDHEMAAAAGLGAALTAGVSIAASMRRKRTDSATSWTRTIEAPPRAAEARQASDPGRRSAPDAVSGTPE